LSYLPWTSPDPLDGTAKTLATYISEIQHNVNHLQETAELGVTQFSPAVGETTKFLKNLVEELKTAEGDSKLLGYYGYSSITDVLGHPWSAYPKSAKDKIECWGFKILNDLRQIFDALTGDIYVINSPASGLDLIRISEDDLSIVSTTSLANSPNTSDPFITLDTDFFYILDPSGKRIYKYQRSDYSYVGDYDVDRGGSSGSYFGLTCGGGYVYHTYYETPDGPGRVAAYNSSNLSFAFQSEGLTDAGYNPSGKVTVLYNIEYGNSNVYVTGYTYIEASGLWKKAKILKLGAGLGFQAESVYDSGLLIDESVTDITIGKTNNFVVGNMNVAGTKTWKLSGISLPGTSAATANVETVSAGHGFTFSLTDSTLWKVRNSDMSIETSISLSGVNNDLVHSAHVAVI